MSSWSNSGILGHILFPAPPPTYTIDSFPGELLWVPRAPAWGSARVQQTVAAPDPADYGDEPVPCLMLTCEFARYLIIFFHSNGEDLGQCSWFCRYLKDQFQVHVLAVEYPDYGVCPGPRTREAVMSNANSAVRFAIDSLGLPPSRIKIFGRSIGTGLAIELAARYRVAGLVLVTPFKNVRTLFRDRIGPLANLVDDWFPNDDTIKKVTSPTLIIHGENDGIIPISHSEVLYKECSAKKLFKRFNDMHHNTNLSTNMEILAAPVFKFFALPDYSFQKFAVPFWAYDKRRSSLYVRPEAQVLSRRKLLHDGAEKADGITWVPGGDHGCEDKPQEPCAGDPAPDPQVKRISVDLGRGPVTHGTVLHHYSATKHRYNFAAQPASHKDDPTASKGSTSQSQGVDQPSNPLDDVSDVHDMLDMPEASNISEDFDTSDTVQGLSQIHVLVGMTTASQCIPEGFTPVPMPTDDGASGCECPYSCAVIR